MCTSSLDEPVSVPNFEPNLEQVNKIKYELILSSIVEYFGETFYEIKYKLDKTIIRHIVF